MSLRREIVSPTITTVHGRIVKNTGDGFVAIFESLHDAFRAAITIQREVTKIQGDIPGEERIVFRMGLNLCDAILEDDDIYGDGVNIAARLQEVCAPGALAVTAVVHDQLSHERFSAVDLGELRLKHVSRPIRVFMFHSGERSHCRLLRQHQSASQHGFPRWPFCRSPTATEQTRILPLVSSKR